MEGDQMAASVWLLSHNPGAKRYVMERGGQHPLHRHGAQDGQSCIQDYHAGSSGNSLSPKRDFKVLVPWADRAAVPCSAVQDLTEQSPKIFPQHPPQHLCKLCYRTPALHRGRSTYSLPRRRGCLMTLPRTIKSSKTIKINCHGTFVPNKKRELDSFIS